MSSPRRIPWSIPPWKYQMWIIDTLRPHPVVTSVEGRQWLSLPHTTILIQGTSLLSLLDSGSEVTCYRGCYRTTEFADQVASTTGVHHFRPNLYKYFPCREKPKQTRCSRNDWLNQINAVLDFEQSTLSVTVQGERHTISFHADAFVSEVALPITSIGRMPPSELTLPFDLSTTITPLSGLCEKAESVTTLSREKRDQLYRALASHQVVFNELPGRTHKYVHDIKMHDQTPFVKRAYPIAFSLRPQVEKTIRDMERMGVIKRESSPFASPMTVVKKKDGTVRRCVLTLVGLTNRWWPTVRHHDPQKVFCTRSSPSGTCPRSISGLLIGQFHCAHQAPRIRLSFSMDSRTPTKCYHSI
jgi:hypothetical protein